MNIKIAFAAAVLATMVLGATASHGAEFTDQAVRADFERGTLRLKYSMMGKGASGGAELNKLYLDKQWPALVEGIVGKRYNSDLYYFYLGEAADALGFPAAAVKYYELALAAYRSGDRCTVGIDSCRGIPMPASIATRLEEVRNPLTTRDIAITALSWQGKGEPGVQVEATGARKGAACMTDRDGKCALSVTLRANEALDIVAAGPGLFNRTATVPAGQAAYTLKMRAYRDLVCEPLMSTAKGKQTFNLEQQAQQAYDYAALKSARLDGICTSQFKGARYLSFKLDNETSYNENKLTNYQIGARVFDDVVKPMMLQMAAASSGMKLDGYDIDVRSIKKSFVAESPELTNVAFRFYVPGQLARKFFDKDISSQQLLDGSIVLLNDDRVELKLQ